ncbi:Mitochondrial uncoupling protein 2 [Crenichthys baileyi]|uniref:Mitochondrial uncoupling protein 2 n=1 Tax=Crenichthys baileyi TaxID=28760 RepID=A0AAV9SC08_9TELE
MVGFRPAEVPPTAAVKFVGAGTAACIADLLTFPLDTAKVRLQVQGEASISEAMGKSPAVKYRGVFGTIITMVRTEGPLSLYSGLVAGLQRQMSFASVRAPRMVPHPPSQRGTPHSMINLPGIVTAPQRLRVGADERAFQEREN